MSRVVGFKKIKVYTNENDESIYYRYFNGTSFGAAFKVDNSSDWALQPAITLVGDGLAVFYNHFTSATQYQMRVRYLRNGSWTAALMSM